MKAVQLEIHPEVRTAVLRLPRLRMSRGTIRFVRPLVGLARLLVCQPPMPDGMETSNPYVDSVEREIDVRPNRPAGTSTAFSVFHWIHGGGLIIGDYRRDAWGGDYAGRLGLAGLTLEDAGERELKGVPDRWRLDRVTS